MSSKPKTSRPPKSGGANSKDAKTAITVALITLIGTIVTAIVALMVARTQIDRPVTYTQTAQQLALTKLSNDTMATSSFQTAIAQDLQEFMTTLTAQAFKPSETSTPTIPPAQTEPVAATITPDIVSTTPQFVVDNRPLKKSRVPISPIIAPPPIPISGNISFVEANYDWILMDANSLVEYPIAEISWVFFCPKFSATNEKIVFAQELKGFNAELLTVGLDGSDLSNLTKTTDLRELCAAWSPDGRKLLVSTQYSTCSDVYVMQEDGADLKNLTLTRDIGPIAYNLFSTSPWSPDSAKFVFHSDRDGDFDLYTMNIDGTDLRQITKNTDAEDYAAAWSPDGSRLAYTYEIGGETDIYILDLRTYEMYNLTNTLGQDKYPVWSPDGTKLIFVSNRYGRYDLYMVNSDGTGLRKLTNTTYQITEPNWYP